MQPTRNMSALDCFFRCHAGDDYRHRRLERTRPCAVIGALCAWMAVIVVGIPAASARYAIPANYLSPEVMATQSDAIVRVRLERIETVRIDNRVYTDVHCERLETWNGEPADEMITIRQPGGQHGSLVTWAGPLPSWHVDEEWLLVLNRPSQGWWTVHGLKQGAFRVDGEHAFRDFAGLVLKNPTPTVRDGIERMPLRELERRLLGVADAVSDNRVSSRRIPHTNQAPNTGSFDGTPRGVSGHRDGAESDVRTGRVAGEPRAWLWLFVIIVVGIAGLVRIVADARKRGGQHDP